MQSLLNPESIAIVGASESNSFGGCTTRNILKYKRKNLKVFLVNPKRKEIYGYKSYDSLTQINKNIDLVVICLPRSQVTDIIIEAGHNDIHSAIIFASGYAEIGPIGKQMEEELVKLCNRLDISLLGPNCAGYANYTNNIILFPFDLTIPKSSGHVGLISQSGQVIFQSLEFPRTNFSYVVSCGNSAQLGIEDYLDYLIDDYNTKIIGLYCESIKNIQKFESCLKRAAILKKPIVILKSGISNKSQAIVQSHTGSITGSNKAFYSLISMYGCIIAEDIQELLAFTEIFNKLKTIPSHFNYAFFNVSGGEAAICADLCTKYGLSIGDFSEITKKQISKLLPSYGQVNNPLDVTATIAYDVQKIFSLLKLLQEDDNIDIICIVYTIPDNTSDDTLGNLVEAIQLFREEYPEQLIIWLPFLDYTKDIASKKKLSLLDVPVLFAGKTGFLTLQKLQKFVEYNVHQSINYERKIQKQYRNVLNRKSLSEYDSRKFLINNNVNIDAGFLIKEQSEIPVLMKQIIFPVALKYNSKDICHVSDLGGVVLNIYDNQELIKAFKQINEHVRSNIELNSNLECIILPMYDSELEFIIGGYYDPCYGPYVTFGIGGIYAEIINSITMLPAPVTFQQVFEEIIKTKYYPILDGYRSTKKFPVKELIDLIVQISNLIAKEELGILELDLNPVMITKDAIRVADVLIIKEDR